MSAAHATFVIEQFNVLQSVTVGAGAIGGNTVGDGTTSCWYMVGCYRDIVIDNSAAGHATTASVQYNATTPTIGPNYEFTAHVAAGDSVTFIITWDGDTVSGNFGAVEGGIPVTYFPSFQPYIYSNSGQTGHTKVTLTMKDMDGNLLSAEFSDFTAGGYRPDGYAAPSLHIPWTTIDYDNWELPLGKALAIQAVVTIDATTQPVDFAMRRLKAPEPSSMALTGLALLGMAAVRRRRHRGSA
ncbi:PEP-CTERM sorting domain-containing protein [Ideonella sp. A 288]|uniref:PEP-CTERM sorting domain-containing protein n=1 Tax=Ideonella sp. A 288 TaxID=1962181 RepID=UPI0013039E35|nr:PEP-CTERM sorting domain-containing protein [Ideonella sp. A 288]